MNNKRRKNRAGGMMFDSSQLVGLMRIQNDIFRKQSKNLVTLQQWKLALVLLIFCKND